MLIVQIAVGIVFGVILLIVLAVVLLVVFWMCVAVSDGFQKHNARKSWQQITRKSWQAKKIKPLYTASDVSRILAIPLQCDDPPPQFFEGEVVIYYGGWDLLELSKCIAGEAYMSVEVCSEDWRAAPGYYRFHPLVPGSGHKSWSEQVLQLANIGPAWQPAPVCVAATAILVHLAATGENLLKNKLCRWGGVAGWCRCAESLSADRHVILQVDDDHLRVYDYRDDFRRCHGTLCAIRKSLV